MHIAQYVRCAAEESSNAFELNNMMDEILPLRLLVTPGYTSYADTSAQYVRLHGRRNFERIP